MKKEEFDKIIRTKVKEQIKAPQELKERIKKEISEIDTKPKRSLKFIQGIAAVFTVAILGITTYAGITGNLNLEKMGMIKASQNYMENALDINKKISNEYIDIILKSIACDNSYIIMEYQIDTKEQLNKKYGEIKSSANGKYNLEMREKTKVNDEIIEIEIDNINKIGENSYSYFKVYNIMNIKDKRININVELQDIEINDGEVEEESDENNSIPINKNIKLEISRMDTNIQKFVRLSETVENKTINIEDVVNSNFETFILAKQILKDVTIEEYQSNSTRFNDFIVTQSNGDDIPHAVYIDKIYVTNKQRDKMLYSDISEEQINKREKVTIEENYHIILGKTPNDIKNIKVIARESSLLNDRTNEEEDYYNKAKWYKLENKKYSANNNVGGKLEIENIEITKDKIIFYYNKSGDLQNALPIIIRKNNNEYNYICPSIEEEKDINSIENKIVFLRNDSFFTGVFEKEMEQEEFGNILKDVSKLEFTMLFGKNETKNIGNGFEISIPNQNLQKIDIIDVRITDIEKEYVKYDTLDLEDKEDIEIEDEEKDSLEAQVREIEYLDRIRKIVSKNEKAKSNKMSICGIKIGMTKQEVEQFVGEPNIENEGLENGIMAAYGPENCIQIEYAKEDKQYKVIYMTISIVELSMSPEDLQTDTGIKIGDNIETVITKYAKDSKIERVPEEKENEEKINYVLYGKEEIKSVDGNNVVGKEKDSEYAYISFPKKEPINEEETKTVYIQYVAGDRAIRYEIKDGVVINIIMFNEFYM